MWCIQWCKLGALSIDRDGENPVTRLHQNCTSGRIQQVLNAMNAQESPINKGSDGRWLFCVAPMMDWTGTSQKAKRDQHLSHVSIGHVVPNEVPPLVRSFDEQAVSRFCACSAAAA
jgi:hypothetical protein